MPGSTDAKRSREEEDSAEVPVSSLFRLDGKIALITGSSQGIGFSLARGLAAAGAKVVLNGRDKAKLEKAKEQLIQSGHSIVGAVDFDVTDEVQVKSAIDGIEKDVGPIDILINNAGVQHRAPLKDFPSEQWERLKKTNLDGVFFTGRAAA